MNGGKDVKIGHDKRPVSVIPNDEQPLYNISSGEVLTDEFGNPLITEVDQFFTNDASTQRATSVVFPELPTNKSQRNKVTQVAISTATYGVDLDVDVVVNSTTNKIPVIQIGGGVVSVGITALLADNSTTVQFSPSLNQVEIRTVNANVSNEKSNLYFPDENLTYISGVTAGNKVFGANIPDGSFVVGKKHDKIKISNDIISGITTDKVTFFNTTREIYAADNVLKIAEVFRETSEVSTTLLGVNRAETQLSLFSNVSSYGINSDDWESFSYNTGVSRESWERRNNAIYGRRYLAKIEEETQESAIKLSAFPPPYSFPFGPNYEKIGLYDATAYQQYKNFITLGNQSYNYFSQAAGYSADFAAQFLNPSDAKIDGNNDIVYDTSLSTNVDAKFDYAFAKIDTWTDTWRSLIKGITDPVTGNSLTFATLKNILADSGFGGNIDGADTRPGYRTNYRRYSAIQSRRVFRYQPGRISGFTFGLRSSTEPVSGVALEWGISNETDAYVFKIYLGQLSIVRRSTIPLSQQVLRRNGIDPIEDPPIQINGTSYDTVQPFIASGDPFDTNDGEGPLRQEDTDGGNEDLRTRKYHTVEISRDNFNGDPLNGNGPSGYTIEPDKVTMWKIEFGWYGAIGARFYAYIPAGAGDARWVVVHTLVIENSLTAPCLRDSYFRFKYSLNIFDNQNIRTPQFLYKYGASYYIDGGDEGTSEIYAVSTGLSPKQINNANETSLFAIRPKDLIINSTGTAIVNRKLVLPTKFSMTTNTLTEVKVRTCKGCQGHGHIFTPGVGTTISGRDVELEFIQGNKVNIKGTDAFFTEDDIGAKLIAPSLFNAYITDVDDLVAGSAPPRYESAFVYGWGKGLDAYPNYNQTDRPIGGVITKDYANSGITTTIGITDATTGVGGTYPHPVRLSNYDVHFASDFPLSGTEIKIQFMNPIPHDQSSLSSVDNTHWADFMIGVTDKKPTVTGANDLVGWDSLILPWNDYGNAPDYVGSGATSILPESEILFGESTHSWANMDEDGVEVGEAWAPTNYRSRMGEDVRIPSVTSASGGGCSTLFIKVNSQVDLATDVVQEYRNGTLPSGITTTGGPKYYLVKNDGAFSGGISDWKGGEVVFKNNDGTVNTTGNALYNQRKPVSFINASQQPSQYIEITDSANPAKQYDPNDGDPDGTDTGLTIVGRTVQCKGGRLNETKVKLFTYGVFPLYLVGKMMDNAKINNITITEKSLTFSKTTSPKLYVTQNSNGFIDVVSNNALNDQTPPTNFKEVERLSSASVDTQNQRPLRTSITKDIFYIGEDKTKEVDMTKIFGIDRNVITPDNQNVEATFFTAKQLGSGSAKFVQSSLNFKEQ